MINLEMSTIIYRPIKQVFDFVSTPENDFQWQYGTLATTSLSEGIGKKGTSFRSVGHLMGHRVQSRALAGLLDFHRLFPFEELPKALQPYLT